VKSGEQSRLPSTPDITRQLLLHFSTAYIPVGVRFIQAAGWFLRIVKWNSEKTIGVAISTLAQLSGFGAAVQATY
jgi:hypothetical protein